MHMDFAMNHLRGEAAQDIQTHCGFVVTQKEFDGPTQAIEFGDIRGRECNWIQQGSGQSNGAGSEASGLD